MFDRLLDAEWRHLLMLNFTVEPSVLERRLPPGTELDLYDGRAYLSVVGFLFQNSRLFGIPAPGHGDFEEVNLRFYVVRHVGHEIRRGVVFVREIAPRPLLAAVARWVYEERYITLPMQRELSPPPDGPWPAQLPSGARLTYRWRLDKNWQHVGARVNGPYADPSPGSEAHFITDHFWGYTACRDGGTLEYRVEHRPWRVAPVRDAEFVADIAALYGQELVPVLTQPPVSALVADGSVVVVRRGRRLPHQPVAKRESRSADRCPAPVE